MLTGLLTILSAVIPAKIGVCQDIKTDLFARYLKRRSSHLNAIAIQESGQNGDVRHKMMPYDHPIHGGARAFGKYGLMPATIKLTIKKHKDLYNKYKHILLYDNHGVHDFMSKNRYVEELIVSRLYDEYAAEFGQNLALIYYSWLYGPGRTRRDLANAEVIFNNKIVKKVVSIHQKLQQNQ